MKNLPLLTGFLCAVVAASGGRSVSAQSIDYGSLEDLFGEPITLSATGTPLKVSDAPTNMTIVTADEIRQSGSRQIPEILERVAGLDLLQTGINVFDVGVRGYQQPFQPRLLVLVDGRQVFLDDYSRTAWDNIPVNVDDIRQIEVVKGASSAIFGPNAAGGMINIVTYSPLYDKNNVASFRGGTQDTITGDATTTFNGNWGGTKFTLGGMTAKDFATFRYPLDQPAAKPQHRYATNSSVFKLNKDIDAFTEATFSDSTGNTADEMNGCLMGRQDLTTYSVRGGGNWQSSIGMLTLDNYFNHSYISIKEPTDGGSPYVTTVDLIASLLRDQFKIGADHTFRVAFDYKHKKFKMKGAQLLQPQSPELSEDMFGVGGVWHWEINDQWAFTNALRYGHLDMEETGTLMEDSVNTYSDYSHALNAVSANANIVFKPTDVDTLRLGYGRGLQAPSLINSGYSLFQNFGTAGDPYLSLWEGNPKLKPTVIQDYSFDYTRKVPEIFSFAKISVFYELNQDLVSPLCEIGTVNIGGVDYPYGKSINVGSSSGYGGELQIKGNHPDGYRWDASYSFTRITDSQSALENMNYQESAPQHHFRLGLGYTTGSWELDGFGQYASSTNMYRSPDGGWTWPAMYVSDWYSFSARAGYAIDERFTVALSGRNLNQNTITTSPFPALERQVFLTFTGKF